MDPAAFAEYYQRTRTGAKGLVTEDGVVAMLTD